MDRTVVSRATSAVTSTSPNAKDAETRTLESRTALEASHREIQHLAGRLIAAQDAERARIARDLHDDVSQQLAGVINVRYDAQSFA